MSTPRTSTPRERPPFVADERTQLLGWLDLQRDICRWKTEGLSAADAHRAVLPSSPLMTAAGIISHLRWVEHAWFEVIFLNRPAADNPQFREEPEDGDMLVAGVPLDQLLDDYRRQCAVSNEIVAAHALDDTGRNPEVRAAAGTLRWMLLHMLEETARHAGHLDLIREQLDGRTGYY
ncbi:DinB family protein [Streptomyces sp. DSM 44915]|uniref:DinB family protein n=1 Tax=Streptomyces chisholmiae TaxID=3075540 RepID=A0ABU2JP81_9ACTN|nr:DinB family protein [Streptomyces sp. DSM 44915]MDT0266541.1 DinB family protein [Streptomyces sp. DSM 44915]